MPPEIVCDTVFGSTASLKKSDLGEINWCLAPIMASGVIVCDTVFWGDCLLKLRGLTVNNWCLAPIILGEGNCV